MSWTITPTQLLVDDQDAVTYLAAVEAADGQALESGVRLAVNAFVKGCKNDGIWPAIKACCILSGARTRLGALTPLVGAAPTSFNFVDGDYNRKTGLVGDGSTKYLNSNRNNNADPQNSKHISVYATTASTTNVASNASSAYGAYIGSANGSSPFDGSHIARDNGNGQLYARSNSGDFSFIGAGGSTGFVATNRASSGTWSSRVASNPASYTQASSSNRAEPIIVFNTGQGVATVNSAAYSNARLAFYSIGESLNLALLDTRVTTLVNALSAAIP